MKRRSFIANSLLAAGSVSMSMTLPKQADELQRWLWMRPPKDFTTGNWLSFFDKCRKHRIHGVFLQVYNGASCHFTHPHLPIVDTLLERLVPMAKNAGVELHAWMWTMICNNKDIVENHTDWYAVNGQGEPANVEPAYVGYYRFMCARHPEVRDFVRRTVSALSGIDGLSGIHLDYVRQPDVILAEALQTEI